MMVRALHAAGIEVILDVVYNHTAEGNQMGPTLSFRGIDNASYYRLAPTIRATTWTSPAAATRSTCSIPRVLQLIMDSLRYWVLEMHVDGFRFDLASTLARELYEVNRLGAFFDIIHQDPVLSQVKLIAEPWDVGPGGYQVGNFPVGWTEWNGKYRDTVRRFWKGDGGLASEFATRLAGSSDLYQQSGRAPYASINFITCHDGFTLEDLVSYNEKHNEANGEEQPRRRQRQQHLELRCRRPHGRSGDSCLARSGRSATHRHAVSVARRADAARRRRTRATPRRQQQRLLPGQRTHLVELGTRRRATEFLDSSRTVPGSGRSSLSFNAARFSKDRAIRGRDVKDISFFNPSGKKCPMKIGARDSSQCLGVRLAGDMIGEVSERGEPIVGDTILLLLERPSRAD